MDLFACTLLTQNRTSFLSTVFPARRDSIQVQPRFNSDSTQIQLRFNPKSTFTAHPRPQTLGVLAIHLASLQSIAISVHNKTFLATQWRQMIRMTCKWHTCLARHARFTLQKIFSTLIEVVCRFLQYALTQKVKACRKKQLLTFPVFQICAVLSGSIRQNEIFYADMPFCSLRFYDRITKSSLPKVVIFAQELQRNNCP